jgi:hypothetical protein
VAATAYPARAGEQEARAVIDKAITALGGQEKLSKIRAFSVTGKGTVVLAGQDVPFTFRITAQGIERYRSSYEAEFDGQTFKGVTVLDGEKGWRKSEEETKRLDADELANEKRNAYLEILPILILPLKGGGFKLDSAPDEKVVEKPAAAVRVTGPDGKEFTICFDKESGLPVLLRGRVKDDEGEEFTEESTFEDYKEFQGIKVATRSKSKRDGERYIEVEGMDFKVIDNVEPDTFTEPK